LWIATIALPSSYACRSRQVHKPLEGHRGRLETVPRNEAR
jgi:hypothetical protein